LCNRLLQHFDSSTFSQALFLKHFFSSTFSQALFLKHQKRQKKTHAGAERKSASRKSALGCRTTRGSLRAGIRSPTPPTGRKRSADATASLAEIFTRKQADVIETVGNLMRTRRMTVRVQQMLTSNNYFESGHGRDECQMLTCKLATIVAVGQIQQVLVAGLQILYDVRANERALEGEDYSVLYYCEGGVTNIKVTFKFHGQWVNLSLYS
jgi:hypothetical protein